MTDRGAAALELLKDRIDLRDIPFTERGSRLLLFHQEDGFRLRVAERWFKRDRQLSAYRQRPPLIEDWVFLGADGEALSGELRTAPHRVDYETAVGVFTISFLDEETLLICLPAALCGIRMQAYTVESRADRRGGVSWLSGDIHRRIAYTTNARIVSNEIRSDDSGHQLIRLTCDATEGGRALTVNVTPRLASNRSIPPVEWALADAEARWVDWFDRAPSVRPEREGQYFYAWWILRAGLISRRFYTTREAMMPSKIHYVGVWQWDALFHAIAYRHTDAGLAHDQVRVVLDHQREDGMLPDAIHDEGTVTHLDFPVASDVTKPPLAAWAVWKVHEAVQDRDFLDEVYEPLARWNAWWFEQCDSDQNRMPEYHHPFSSGLDDSPLWDQGVPTESPDLATYLFLHMEALSLIAAELGLADESREWTRRAEEVLQRTIETQWDEAAGLFWARHEGEAVRVKTPFSLFPICSGRLPEAFVDRLAAHLADPSSFWPAYPVPTVALDDPHYNSAQMWRGPTWLNVNYLLIEGLQRSGQTELARELRSRTLALVETQRDIYEYYDPSTAVPPPRAAPIFGWSAALYVDLAIQEAAEGE